MNENRHERNERMEMDAARLLGVLWQKKLLIAVVAMLLALVTFAGTWFLIAPKYQSTAMFYVNNYSKLGESAGSITSSDITASKNLVDSYIVILNTRSSLEDVISTAGVSLTCEELEEMLDASAVNSTEIFQVVVTSTDRDEALKIAEAITVVLPQRISSILEGTSANVVDVPVIASGGAGCIDDFIKLFKALPGVDAGLAASIFHFGEVSIRDLKLKMAQQGIPARL